MKFTQHVTELAWACEDANQELQLKPSILTS